MSGTEISIFRRNKYDFQRQVLGRRIVAVAVLRNEFRLQYTRFVIIQHGLLRYIEEPCQFTGRIILFLLHNSPQLIE